MVNFSKELGIYENPDELLSISLGSTETTLLKLTSAYSTFVNGGKLVEPILIDRVQDSEGNTIVNNDKRSCINCDQISFLSNKYPKIKDKYKKVISEQTAYQITSLLEGVIKRGTGKKLKRLELNLAGKTGTTNENTDAWFIGFTSNFVIGVYVGMDDPAPLGKFETGSKTALPIFEKFIMKAVKKSDARPFKVPNGITMMVVDPITGDKALSPVIGSTTIIVIPFGTLNGLASDFLTAFMINFSKIGRAVLDPVSNLPNGAGSSMPTYTPITKFDVKPMNQASVFSLVVPVFPAKFNSNLFNFFPVPLFITPSRRDVI